MFNLPKQNFNLNVQHRNFISALENNIDLTFVTEYQWVTQNVSITLSTFSHLLIIAVNAMLFDVIRKCLSGQLRQCTKPKMVTTIQATRLNSLDE